MDSFLAACQGLGLALAAGVLVASVIGFPLARVVPGRGSTEAMLVLAGALGALLFWLSLDAERTTAWPGVPGGLAAAALGAAIAYSILSGASERAGGSALTLAAICVLAALAVAGLALLVPPLSLLALAGLLVLAAGRRRRAGRKYEGLRLLR